MGLRTQHDRIPEGERSFILASIKKAIVDGDTPITVRNFGGTKKQEVATNGE